MSDDFSDKYFPIGISAPLTTEFDPSTGELIVGCLQQHPSVPGGIQMRLFFDAKATEQLLSSLPTLQKEFGELVEAKANKRFLQ